MSYISKAERILTGSKKKAGFIEKTCFYRASTLLPTWFLADQNTSYIPSMPQAKPSPSQG